VHDTGNPDVAPDVGSGGGKILLVGTVVERRGGRDELGLDLAVEVLAGGAVGKVGQGYGELTLPGLDRSLASSGALRATKTPFGTTAPAPANGTVAGALLPAALFAAAFFAAAFFAAALPLARVRASQELSGRTASPGRNRQAVEPGHLSLVDRHLAPPVLGLGVTHAEEQANGDDLGVQGLGRGARLRAPLSLYRREGDDTQEGQTGGDRAKRGACRRSSGHEFRADPERPPPYLAPEAVARTVL